MHRRPLGSAPRARRDGAHGPSAAASQSTLLAESTTHAPRSAPVVSKAKSIGSLPESLIVNTMPGCSLLTAAPEFSTSSLRACMGTTTSLVGCAPAESPPYAVAAERRVSAGSLVPHDAANTANEPTRTPPARAHSFTFHT